LDWNHDDRARGRPTAENGQDGHKLCNQAAQRREAIAESRQELLDKQGGANWRTSDRRWDVMSDVDCQFPAHASPLAAGSQAATLDWLAGARARINMQF
jgi:hypothetical protein